MSYTYLLEGGAEYSAESFLDIPASVLSRLNLTAEKSYCNASATESCQSSQSGTMCEHSTVGRGEDLLTCCTQEYHARRCPSSEAEADSYRKITTQHLGESFAKLDPLTLRWKTPQLSLFEDSADFLGTWPQWGMMLGGECWEHLMPGSSTTERESGFYLPTPSGVNGGKNHTCGRLDEWGGSRNPWRGTEIGKVRCPAFEEWVMGWPVSWTELTPLEMDKFQQWLSSHGQP